MSTVTPGRMAPVESRTMPLTLADAAVCPRADGAAQLRNRIANPKAGDQDFDRMKQHTSGGCERAAPTQVDVQRPDPFRPRPQSNANRGARSAHQGRIPAAICCGFATTRGAGSGAGRRRFGTVGAKDGRPGRDARRITKCESAYDRRYDRHGAKAAGQRDERRVGPRAHAAHLAGSHAFLGVVHRADLTGQQARAAFFVVPGDGHVLATERHGRRGHVRNLEQQPCANRPRQPAARRCASRAARCAEAARQQGQQT